MPVKYDHEKRWVELELVVPGTAEQVWHAVATGAGYSAWFTDTTIDETVGGRIEFDFGSNGTSTGEVTRWEPPHRFGYIERDWCADAPPVATEVNVTGRAENLCVLQMVHSLPAAGDHWDTQLEGFESGWPAHFAVLRTYLAHFAGSPASAFHLTTRSDLAAPEAWKQLTSAFGVHGADVDDLRSIGRVADNVTGLVERISQDEQQRHLLTRLAQPTPGVAVIGLHTPAGKSVLGVNAFFYGDDAATQAETIERTWRKLLEEASR